MELKVVLKLISCIFSSYSSNNIISIQDNVIITIKIQFKQKKRKNNTNHDIHGFIYGKYLSKSLFNSDIEKYKKIFAKNVTLEILQNIFKEVKYNPTDELPPKDFAEILENYFATYCEGNWKNVYESDNNFMVQWQKKLM